MGVDDWELGFRALLSDPARPTPRADADAALSHGHLPGDARIWAHLRHRRHPGRDLPGPLLRDHFRHADADGYHGWGRRAVGNRRAARRHRELLPGLLDRHRV